MIRRTRIQITLIVFLFSTILIAGVVAGSRVPPAREDPALRAARAEEARVAYEMLVGIERHPVPLNNTRTGIDYKYSWIDLRCALSRRCMVTQIGSAGRPAERVDAVKAHLNRLEQLWKESFEGVQERDRKGDPKARNATQYIDEAKTLLQREEKGETYELTQFAPWHQWYWDRGQ